MIPQTVGADLHAARQVGDGRIAVRVDLLRERLAVRVVAGTAGKGELPGGRGRGVWGEGEEGVRAGEGGEER